MRTVNTPSSLILSLAPSQRGSHAGSRTEAPLSNHTPPNGKLGFIATDLMRLVQLSGGDTMRLWLVICMKMAVSSPRKLQG